MVVHELFYCASRKFISNIFIPCFLKTNRKLKCYHTVQRCHNTLENSVGNFRIDINPKPDSYLTFSDCYNDEEKAVIKSDMVVMDDFLHEDEEKSLIEELEPHMKRMRYQFDHWDDAIHGYRETERLKWNEKNTTIINRVRSLAFPNVSKTLTLVHVLDLAEDGYIKPHIDSVRFCGDIIAGLSLLSNSVMRLVHNKQKEKVVDVLLKRRSLYIMRDCARYDYTHEILSNKLSVFKGAPVKKTRRISVICRNEPKKEDMD